MATPRWVRAEVWNNFEAAAGTRLAIIPDVLDLEDRESVSEGQGLTLVLPINSPAQPYIAARYVLRTVFADDSVREYRILTANAGSDLTVSVDGVDPRVVLGDLVIYRTEGDGSHTYAFGDGMVLTAAEHLSKVILPALAAEGYTWIAAGTIDPTQPIDLVYNYATPLQAILALAVGYEFRLRRNGTTQYLVDILTRIGSTAATRYVRAGRDLLSLRRTLDGAPIATRVLPKGMDEGGVNASMAEAQWKVTAFTASTDVTLADPLGGDGPLLKNDQLNGFYLEKANGSRVLISDSVAATQKILVADTTNVAVNDLVKIRKTSGGEVLDYLQDPVYGAPVAGGGYGVQTKVLDTPDLPSTVNLLGNPAMRTYTTATNAPPDTWGVIPGSGLAAANVDKDTGAANWRVGGQSAKLVLSADGHGIETAYATIAPTDAKPYFSGFAGFWNDTVGAKVRGDLIAGLATLSISSMTRATAGGITTVTATTSAVHGRATGDPVEILGSTGATTADGYNGLRKVSRIVSTTVLEYQLTADPGGITLSSATLRPVYQFATPGEAAAKVWHDYGIQNVDLKKLACIVAKIRVMQDGTTAATIYADRAQLTQGAGEGQKAFIEGNGPTRLWQAANAYLNDNAPPATRYEATALDLAKLDGQTWANEDLVLGQTITFVYPGFPGSPITTRLIDLKRKLKLEGDCTLGLSTRPTDITDSLVRTPRQPRLPAPGADPRRTIRQVRVQAAKFVPKTTADLANLQYNLAGGSPAGLYPINGATALASASIVDDLLVRGGRIVALRSDLSQQTAGAGTVKLYRDGTLLSTLTAAGTGPQSDTTLSQRVGGEAYWLEASLQQVSPTIFAFLTYVELDIEIDEVKV